jgi:hypothetical protein
LPNFADESNQYKETATDDRNHNLNGHVIIFSWLMVLAGMGWRL